MMKQNRILNATQTLPTVHLKAQRLGYEEYLGQCVDVQYDDNADTL